MKKLFIILSFLSVLFLNPFDTFAENKQGIETNKSFVNLDDDEYTYVRVYIEGLWWIFVYDKDGRLIDVYLDSNQ